MSERDADADDVTIWAGRLRAWPNAPHEGQQDAPPPVDDETVLARRRAAEEPTVLARRASPAAPVEPGPAAEAVDDVTVPGRRRLAASDDEPDDDTAPGSRERARPAVVPAARVRQSEVRAAQGLPEERKARVPSSDDREIYRPRPVESEVVTRAAPTRREPQASVDVAAASASRARRDRRRALAAIVVGALAAGLAIVAVVWAIVVPA